jgi:phosphatidylglycerol lysyltransferase
LREQLRRARAKQVEIRPVAEAELPELEASVGRLAERWLSEKPMAPLGFLVSLQPLAFPSERRAWKAERAGALVGWLTATPLYARNGWLLEHLLRDPTAPNGTAELLVDAVMRAAAAEGRSYLTLGLAPLAGEVAGWLRAARAVGTPLYDFEGLRAFKARLRPHGWDRIHLAWPAQHASHWPVYDTLTAFARGSLARFGVVTLLRRPVMLVWVLAVLLVPWTALLALPANAHRFPSPLVQWGWVLFDVGLTGALFTLVRRWRSWLATLLGTVITGDACLTLLQALAYNVPRAHGLVDWLIIGVAVLGPSLAAVLLFWARGHASFESG